jgi:hypothetical protein
MNFHRAHYLLTATRTWGGGVTPSTFLPFHSSQFACTSPSRWDGDSSTGADSRVREGALKIIFLVVETFLLQFIVFSKAGIFS